MEGACKPYQIAGAVSVVVLLEALFPFRFNVYPFVNELLTFGLLRTPQCFVYESVNGAFKFADFVIPIGKATVVKNLFLRPVASFILQPRLSWPFVGIMPEVIVHRRTGQAKNFSKKWSPLVFMLWEVFTSEFINCFYEVVM